MCYALQDDTPSNANAAKATGSEARAAETGRPSQARPGEVVIKEGDEGDTFYVLFSGTADIIVGGQKVGDYRAGQSFGELALLREGRAETWLCVLLRGDGAHALTRQT